MFTLGIPLPSHEPLFTWRACVAAIGVSRVGREAGDEPLTVGRPVGDVREEGLGIKMAVALGWKEIISNTKPAKSLFKKGIITI